MTDEFLFARPELANALAEQLTSRGPFAFTSGLFLAAPRRTGKSTFLRRDLTPALEQRDVKVVYVDLWEDLKRDPADLIRAQLIEAHRQLAGWLAQRTASFRAKRIGIPGLASIDLAEPASAASASLTELLGKLAALARSDVALIVDEAQHARTTESGRQAMFALKAARDAFAQQTRDGDDARLILLFTGSDRQKLSQLMATRAEPFYGASLQDFPQLGDDYCDAFAEHLNRWLAPQARIEGARLARIFEQLGRRPEWLTQTLRTAFTGPGLDALEQVATDHLARQSEHYAAQFEQMSPLEAALVARIAARGGAYRPFAKDSVAEIQGETGEQTGTAQVQSAIQRLMHEQVLWSPGRGQYELEDADFGRWIVESRSRA